MTVKPWTFEDFEIDPRPSWEIYDENLARTVAVFYDQKEARSYLEWRNRKQAKRRAKKAAAAAAHQSHDHDYDDDGRC